MTTSEKPLTIGIFTDDFYPNSGGVARSIELQIHELQHRGHRVILFAPKPFFVPPQDIESVAVDSWHIRGAPSYLCSIKFSQQIAQSICKKYKFDIVHSQNERGSMFLAARIARLASIPHVHTFHSNYAGTHRTAPISAAINTFTYMRLAPYIMSRIRSDLTATTVKLPRNLTSVENSRLAKFDWKSVAQLAQFMDGFTSPAAYVIDNINDATRQHTIDRGFVVPNGINDVFRYARRIRPLEDTIRFLSCGRLDPEKRVDVIIKAFAKLPADDVELYILGSGTDEGRLKQLARDLQPKNRIVFLGHFEDHERVANEFANADVFVFASYRFDTQGMVLAEAASAGAAILYCDNRLVVGVSQDNSLLTTPSVTGFESGMNKLMQDIPAIRTMQSASRELRDRLTSARMCERFLRVYDAALSRTSSSER